MTETCQLDGEYMIVLISAVGEVSVRTDLDLMWMCVFCVCLCRADIKEDDKSLIIKNVVPDDDGIYICEAHNGVGQISAKAQLVVNCKYNRIVCA